MDQTDKQPLARILIVDDDPRYCKYLNKVLSRDYEISIAMDGQSGLSQALTFQPHLVILDVLMPGWDGLTTLQTFRDHPALVHVPIVMVSSDLSQATVRAAIQAGADEYLLKTGMDCDEICRRIARLLHRTQSQAETMSSRDAELISIEHAGEALKGVSQMLGDQTTAPSMKQNEFPNDIADLQAILDSWK